MRKPSIKTLFLIVLLVVVVTIPIYTLYYFGSTRTISVSAKNISAFSISQEGNTTKSKIYSANTHSIRISKNKKYLLTYTAVNGYQGGTENISVTDTAIAITPDYSLEKLDNMLTSQIDNINSQIRQSGTNIEVTYVINRGTLSNYGNWYFTTLTYKGSSDDDNSDTLVVGLQKKNGEWKVILNPDIFFTTAAYPSVSRDFIDAANTYQKTHVIPTEL